MIPTTYHSDPRRDSDVLQFGDFRTVNGIRRAMTALQRMQVHSQAEKLLRGACMGLLDCIAELKGMNASRGLDLSGVDQNGNTPADYAPQELQTPAPQTVGGPSLQQSPAPSQIDVAARENQIPTPPAPTQMTVQQAIKRASVPVPSNPKPYTNAVQTPQSGQTAQQVSTPDTQDINGGNGEVVGQAGQTVEIESVAPQGHPFQS